ncbi:MAG: YaiI/YqxD family protein [Alphaproteobacteria bacterium]|nr:YaiI/YqxD family protein [Alphaproteobacteria bacterium]
MVYVDADACPVKDEVTTIAIRHGCRAVMVCNGGIRPHPNPLIDLAIVNDGPDAADIWIADHAGALDVVVTNDIPLAARVVENGAAVLRSDGSPVSADNVGNVLATRDLMTDMRAADPFRQAKGRPFSKADRGRFSQALDQLLSRAAARG